MAQGETEQPGFLAGLQAGGRAGAAVPDLGMSDEASLSIESESLAVGIGAALMLVVAPRLQAIFVITVLKVILPSRGFRRQRCAPGDQP